MQAEDRRYLALQRADLILQVHALTTISSRLSEAGGECGRRRGGGRAAAGSASKTLGVLRQSAAVRRAYFVDSWVMVVVNSMGEETVYKSHTQACPDADTSGPRGTVNGDRRVEGKLALSWNPLAVETYTGARSSR